MATSLHGLYQEKFGRAPDASGYAYWSDQVSKGASLDSIATLFDNSAEGQKHAKVQAAVEATGKTYTPSTSGWGKAMHSGNVTADDAVAAIQNEASNNVTVNQVSAGSDDSNITVTGSTSASNDDAAAAVVASGDAGDTTSNASADLYNTTLSNSVAVMNAGANNIAAEPLPFSTSSSTAAGQTDEEFVNDLYTNILGRTQQETDDDLAGRTYWIKDIDKMRQNNMSEEDIKKSVLSNFNISGEKQVNNILYGGTDDTSGDGTTIGAAMSNELQQNPDTLLTAADFTNAFGDATTTTNTGKANENTSEGNKALASVIRGTDRTILATHNPDKLKELDIKGLNVLYDKYLDREVRDEGIDYWIDRLNAGDSWEKIESDIASSEQKETAIAKQTGGYNETFMVGDATDDAKDDINVLPGADDRIQVGESAEDYSKRWNASYGQYYDDDNNYIDGSYTPATTTDIAAWDDTKLNTLIDKYKSAANRDPEQSEIDKWKSWAKNDEDKFNSAINAIGSYDFTEKDSDYDAIYQKYEDETGFTADDATKAKLKSALALGQVSNYGSMMSSLEATGDIADTLGPLYTSHGGAAMTAANLENWTKKIASGDTTLDAAAKSIRSFDFDEQDKDANRTALTTLLTTYSTDGGAPSDELLDKWQHALGFDTATLGTGAAAGSDGFVANMGQAEDTMKKWFLSTGGTLDDGTTDTTDTTTTDTTTTDTTTTDTTTTDTTNTNTTDTTNTDTTTTTNTDTTDTTDTTTTTTDTTTSNAGLDSLREEVTSLTKKNAGLTDLYNDANKETQAALDDAADANVQISDWEGKYKKLKGDYEDRLAEEAYSPDRMAEEENRKRAARGGIRGNRFDIDPVNLAAGSFQSITGGDVVGPQTSGSYHEARSRALARRGNAAGASTSSSYYGDRGTYG